MFELLRRLGAAGAAEVRVMTDNYRDAAYAFYQACDFQIVGNVIMYRRDVIADLRGLPQTSEV